MEMLEIGKVWPLHYLNTLLYHISSCCTLHPVLFVSNAVWGTPQPLEARSTAFWGPSCVSGGVHRSMMRASRASTSATTGYSSL